MMIEKKRLVRNSWLVLFIFFLLSGCSGYRHDFFDMMMRHELRRAGLTAETLDVNGKSIAVLESRRDPGKPTVVLVHGFAASKENWVRFAAHLTGSCHVVAVDLPGHGESAKDFAQSYGIADQVGYLHDILAELKVNRFHLSGNSMGGEISALYAVRYPDEVMTLTLMNPAGIHDHESELLRRLNAGEKNPLIVETPADFDYLFHFAMEKPPFVPWPIKSVFAERAAANRAINEKIFKDIRKTNPGIDFKAEIRKINAPTLIIWGDRDRIIDVGNADEFEKLIPGSRKHVFEGVGHAPMIEIPGEAAEIFKSFIFAENLHQVVSLDKTGTTAP